MSGALLEIENLTKSFGGGHAVRNCTFAVPEGQVTGLIGPNGAGKSTVVDLVSGFGRPDSGSVRWAGEPIRGKRPDVISRLGLIRTFQTPREWRNLTVMDNVLLARRRFANESLWRSITRARRIRREEEADRTAVRAILERFQLAELRNELADRLSGGQKRLLEFARIAAAEARLVLLGQPVGGDSALRVRSGQITAIVGPNGAGKSTLLKALVGILRASRGDVYVQGQKTTNTPPEKLVKRGLGYVPQVSNIFPDLTVRENMEMGAYTRRRGVDARIDELCELFPDLGTSLRRRAGILSGGQRSMLAMARALILKPVVMLLDEPSAGLSPLLQDTLWEQIGRISATGVR